MDPAERNEGALIEPAVARQKFGLTRHPVSPALAPFAEYLWVVEWDLAGAEPYTQRVLPAPHVNLTVEPERSRVTGVLTDFEFAYTLRDTGRAVGLRFRAGGFRPFLAGPVSALADRWVPVADLWPWPHETLLDAVLSAPGPAAAAAVLDEAMSARVPAPDPVVDQVADLVDAVAKDPALLRVDALAERAGLSVRSLQRLFGYYVGAGPKWVIRCTRLHEAAARAVSGDPPDWAGLAAELGYSDQSHLVRDFTRVVGESPARYARSARRPDLRGSKDTGARA